MISAKFIGFGINECIVGFILLVVAFFVWLYADRKPLSLSLGSLAFTAGLYYLFRAITLHPISADLYYTLTVWVLYPINYTVDISYYISSILIAEKYTRQLNWQRAFLYRIACPLILINLLVLWYGADFYVPQLRIVWQQGDHTVWGCRVTPVLYVLTFFHIVFFSLALINYYIAYKKSSSTRYQNNKLRIIFIAAIMITTGALIGTVFHFVDDLISVNSDYKNIWINTYLVLYVSAAILMTIGIINYNVLTHEGRKLIKDGIVFFVSNIVYASLYITPVFLVLRFANPTEITPLLVAILFAAVVISHNTYGRLKIILHSILKDRMLTLNIIIEDNVNYALKNIKHSKKLEISPLLRLEQVMLKQRQKGVSDVSALKIVLHEILGELKPENGDTLRSKATLIYQILRMIIEEQATESKILMRLGFEAENNKQANQQDIIKLPVNNDSEYTATSKRSYKRLRKEAIMEYLWKLKERERKALRLPMNYAVDDIIR